MLLFYCLNIFNPETLKASAGHELHASLEAVQDGCEGIVVVVQASLLETEIPEAVATGQAALRVPAIPAEAICNLDPYRPPEPVTAAGGFVVRQRNGDLEVLLILRKGEWDLPKGKQDDGETIEACALREVGEEIGVDALHLGPSLGTTLHGYERDGAYHVKTTHWYLMQTPETTFEPEAREGIEAVAWTSWAEAIEKVGYDTLRRHLLKVEPKVRQALDVSV